MSTRRTAALAVGAAILLGGGATALAATADQPARPVAESAAPSGEAHSMETAAAIDAVDTMSESTVAGTPTDDDGSQRTTAPAPSTTATDPRARSEVAAGADAGRVAGPGAPFGTMPTIPSDWSWRDDGSDTSEAHDDGPGLPFQVDGMGLDTLISLARSVGIEVGTPVLDDDGSTTVGITLPDGTEHTVWAASDGGGHITDATVDGMPITEFVRQFLSGEIGRTRPTGDPHPEWNLPD